MKRAIFIIATIPLLSWAKVANFNSLIEENSQAQKSLQHSLATPPPEIATEPAENALGENNMNTVVLSNISYNAPTDKKALKFKKELTQRRASDKKDQERLAEEIKSMDRDL
jgi:hypothetical protein